VVAVGAEDAVAANASHDILLCRETIRWTIDSDGEIFVYM
jgi:hypothetical protein